MRPGAAGRRTAERTDLLAPALPAGRPNLVITGFMGTGKSSAGREAARHLGLPFVDLDEVIERRAGVSVADLFTGAGEPAFRTFEEEALRDAARLSGTVVATGGGAVLHREAFHELSNGAVTAVLSCEPSELSERLGRTGLRPLLAGAQDPTARVRELLTERAVLYDQAGSSLDTTAATPDQTGRSLADRFTEHVGDAASAVRLEVRAPKTTYAVVVGPGALAELPTVLAAAVPEARRAVVVADGGAVASAASVVADALVPVGLDPLVLELPRGEASKTVGIVATLWDRFRRAGVSRSDVVVAVGGGAALDAAGFAAATFARGIPLANVPTTLLAMVDASLGGKVAVDHAGVKNLVGAFHHPVAVVTDPQTLGTVPPDVLREGLAEAIKAFVLASPLALDLLSMAPLGDDQLPDASTLSWMIEQAVRIKAAYVGEDPEDRGLRQSLNLGHTYAHAIEAATGHTVPHGHAVAAGLVAAARMGEASEVTQPGTAERLVAALERFGLPLTAPSTLDRAAMLEALGADKKRRGGRSVFVVPASGGCALLDGVDPEWALSFLGDG